MDVSVNKKLEVLALDIPINFLICIVSEPSQTRHVYTSSVGILRCDRHDVLPDWGGFY
jgi:hypothetical protein